MESGKNFIRIILILLLCVLMQCASGKKSETEFSYSVPDYILKHLTKYKDNVNVSMVINREDFTVYNGHILTSPTVKELKGNVADVKKEDKFDLTITYFILENGKTYPLLKAVRKTMNFDYDENKKAAVKTTIEFTKKEEYLMEGDEDKDGILNFVELALGSDMKNASSVPVPKLLEKIVNLDQLENYLGRLSTASGKAELILDCPTVAEVGIEYACEVNIENHNQKVSFKFTKKPDGMRMVDNLIKWTPELPGKESFTFSITVIDSGYTTEKTVDIIIKTATQTSGTDTDSQGTDTDSNGSDTLQGTDSLPSGTDNFY